MFHNLFTEQALVGLINEIVERLHHSKVTDPIKIPTRIKYKRFLQLS